MKSADFVTLFKSILMLGLNQLNLKYLRYFMESA